MTLYTLRTRQEMGYPAPNWWQVVPLYPVPKLGTGGQGVRVILSRPWIAFYFWLNVRYNHNVVDLMRWMINQRDSILIDDRGTRWPESLDSDRVGWPMIGIGGNPVNTLEQVGSFFRVEGLQAEVPNLDVKNAETHRHLFHVIYGARVPAQKTPHGIGVMPLLDPRYHKCTDRNASGLWVHESWLKPYELPEVLTALPPKPEPPPLPRPVYIALEQLQLRDKPGGTLKGTLPRGASFELGGTVKIGANIWGEISNRWAVLYWGVIWKRHYTTTWRQS